jgi:hypothetical protein
LAHLVRRDDIFQLSHELQTLAELGSGHRAIPLQRLERILIFIPTTVTATEKLKRHAKTQRKGTGSSLATALDAIAKEQGYINWKHVTWCAEQTKSAPQTAQALPAILAQFLVEVTRDNPPTPETKSTFQSGLVFAVDVKEADDVVLGDDVVPCEDGSPLAAADMWRVYVHVKDDETGTSLVQDLDEEALLEAAREYLMDYRFFRYTGAHAPASLNDAFARVLGRNFFPPTHVWLKGQFLDMEDVPEVQVDGQVVYSSASGGAYRSYSPIRTAAPAAPLTSQLMVPVERQSGIIPRLEISKIEPGFYGYRLSYRDHEMATDAGFSSIREAIESAADIEGDIRGIEVGYAGLTVGTYSVFKLLASAEQVAQQAVETASILQDY